MNELMLDKLQGELRRRWLRRAAVMLVLVAIAELLRSMAPLEGMWYRGDRWLPVLMVAVSVGIGVVLPQLYLRVLRWMTRSQEAMGVEQFFRFQSNVLLLAFVAPVFSVWAAVANFSTMPTLLAHLASVYSALRWYPSLRRLRQDADVLRVRL